MSKASRLVRVAQRPLQSYVRDFFSSQLTKVSLGDALSVAYAVRGGICVRSKTYRAGCFAWGILFPCRRKRDQ